jgi:hypothetical protein
MGGVGFFYISLLWKLQLLRGVVGVLGLAGKGRIVGSRTKLSFVGVIHEATSGGVWRSRLAKDGGLNEEDSWIMLQ